jgi:hypothetical protein
MLMPLLSVPSFLILSNFTSVNIFLNMWIGTQLWKLVTDVGTAVEAHNSEVVFLEFSRKCNIFNPCTLDDQKCDGWQWISQHSTHCKNSEVIISHDGLGFARCSLSLSISVVFQVIEMSSRCMKTCFRGKWQVCYNIAARAAVEGT